MNIYNMNIYIMHTLLLSQNEKFLPCSRGLIFSLWLSGQSISFSLITNVFVILSNMSDLCEGGFLKAHFAMQTFGEK